MGYPEFVVEYLVTDPTDERVVAWATVERPPYGGCTIWSYPYGGDTGPALGGGIARFWGEKPWWRPSEQAARADARELCLSWAREAFDVEPGLVGKLVVQECDEAWVLAEERAPAS